MKNKKLRTFEYNDKSVYFSISVFNEKFLQEARKKQHKINVYEQMLADAVNVDKSAVHNWRMGLNGPGDMSKIEDIASFLNCNVDYLLTEKKRVMNRDRALEKYELDAIYRVGVAIFEFLNKYDSLVTDYMENGVEDNVDFSSFFSSFLLHEQMELERVYYREYIYLANGIGEYVHEFVTGIIPQLFDYGKELEDIDYIDPTYLCSEYWKDYVDYIVTGNDENYKRVYSIWFTETEEDDLEENE